MKTLSSVCANTLQTMQGEVSTVLCDYVMSPSGPHKMAEPIMASDYECGFCGRKEHYAPYLDPTNNTHACRVWLCANVDCDVYKKKTPYSSTLTHVGTRRALEWPKFCELNGIGDLHHDVKFEGINQSKPKVDYLFKFATKPCGIIFMQGNAGSGKTFSSMGVCELFTRRSCSALFTTQTKMLSNWMNQEHQKYTNSVESVELLVVDDFGTGEVTVGFMKFFLDLINTRIQWSNRGTIITTNLDDKKFIEFCGEALNSRIGTGQKLEFREKSRRKQMVL